MTRFLVNASCRTLGGSRTCWSTSVEAPNLPAAQREAHSAVVARYHGATKIDIRVLPEPNQDAGMAGQQGSSSRGSPTTAIELRIGIRMLDEARLREVAAARMAVSGFDADPSTHRDEPLGDLLFEALIGSNSDAMSPVDMGIEIMSWTGHPLA